MGKRDTRDERAGRAAAPFGARLRSMRQAAGLTQEELALRAGLSPNAVGALERGARKRPYPHTVRALADAMGLPEEERAALVATVPERTHVARQAQETYPTAAPPTVLPHPATPLVGREGELGEVVGMLARPEARLVTLTGVGGVGKTRLAVEAARSSLAAGLFPDGIAFVGLAPLGDPALLAPTVLRALGAAEAEGLSPGEALVARLQDEDFLLVLDNFEHLLDAAPEVAVLIEGCPGLTVLVTSRAPLRVRGETEYSVSPLALPATTRSPEVEGLLASPSGMLFFERARAASPGFRLTLENAGAVAAICWRLAGLPLALELAAAKARFLDPAALLSRLDGALSGAWARDLPERQRTVEAALDWSHDLLSGTARTLFRRLSVFVGGFSLEAAEAVGAGGDLGTEEVFVHLGTLVEQSLVVAEVGEGGPLRYRMLEPVRQYALRRLEASGEAEGAGRRHADFFLALSATAEPELRGSGQAKWLERLDRERDNLRAASGWLLASGEAEAAANFGYSAYVFWWIRGYHAEGRRWMEAVLAREPDLSPVGRAKVLFVRGAMAMAQGDHPAAEASYAESRALFEAAGDALGGARPKLGLGLLAMSRADAPEAASCLRKSAEASSEAGDHFWAALSLSALGMVSLGQGDYDAARASLTEGLDLSQRAGDRFSRYIALYNRSVLAQAQGDHDRAEASFEEGLAFSLEVGDHANTAYCLEGLAAVAVARGGEDRAARLLGAARRLREGVGAAVYTYRPDRSLRERTERAARERLGTKGFEEAAAWGLEMGLDRVIEYALGADAGRCGPPTGA